MRKLIRYLGAPVAALAIVATWGVMPASAKSENSERSHRSDNAEKSKESDRVIVKAGESIQQAIDKASPGTTIWVRKGTYAENVEIHKDRIKLIGQGATIVPPASPGSSCHGHEGICVLGDGNPDTGVVNKYVKGAEVRGFTVKGFPGSGFFAFGAQDTEVEWNRFIDNAEYGGAAFTSINTTFERNLSTHAGPGGEAAFYIGDSPNARAHIENNKASGYTLGIFQRNALNVRADHNDIYGNCAGVLVLADAPGPAGRLVLEDNHIHDNNKFCPATTGPEASPAISGVGVLILGGTDNKAHDNWITHNVPSGAAEVSGGIVVLKGGPTGTAPSHNHLTDNVVRDNGTDVVWDGSGVDNLFSDNHCKTSNPANLCS
jgi:nitrous oxidase accessory protein NosD